VRVVAIYNNGNSSLHFNRTVRTLDEAKGLKIRTAGPEEANLISILGAAPVAMAISQVAESLNRGVIDGTLNGFAANTTFKITPLLKAHYEAPFGIRTFFFSIRKNAYDALPAPARAAIDKHSGLATSKAFSETFEREGAQASADAKKDPARHVSTATGAELDALRLRFQPLHARWLEGHQDMRRKYDALHKLIADMRAGRS
jgi:TRAP-type C4-dicarboxylate transport system substrate-binding protein